MKKILFALLTTICTLSSYAQNQYATTSDGKKVLLKDNGTWEYVTGSTGSTSTLYSGGGTGSGSTSSTANPSRKTNTYNTRSSTSSRKATGRTYIRGPRGGCYYINSNGNKTYVDRSLCN